MKPYVQNLAMLSAVIAFGCQSNKNDVPTDESHATPVTTSDTTSTAVRARENMQIVEGIVKEKTPGKDGYTAQIEANDGKIYYATISRVNLKDDKQYRDFNTNELVKLTGEAWTMDGKEQLIVREIN